MMLNDPIRNDLFLSIRRRSIREEKNLLSFQNQIEKPYEKRIVKKTLKN